MLRRNRAYLAAGIALSLAWPWPFSCPTHVDVTKKGIHVRSRKVLPNQQECGVESLYLLLRQQKIESISYADLKSRMSMTSQGVRASDLMKIALSFPIELEAVKTDIDSLISRNRPAILHVHGDHFMLFLHWENNRLVFFDSEIGLFDCSPSWFWRHTLWDGIALIVKDQMTFVDTVTSIRVSLFLVLLLVASLGGQSRSRASSDCFP